MDQSLARIGKSTAIAFVGSLGGMLLAFVSRALIARYGTEAEYGLFSLAFAIVNIGAVIAALGLQQGVPRSIAYAQGENDTEKARKLIPAAVQLGLFAGIVTGGVVFFTADVLATGVFDKPELASLLRIVAFGIPFFALAHVLAAVFRGLGDIKPTAYFLELLKNLLFALFLTIVVLLGTAFVDVFYAFLAALVLSCVALVLYAAKQLPSPRRLFTNAMAGTVGRGLLLFSLPLLGVAMLSLIVSWTDTLMLGAFRNSMEVGLYNAAHPLAGFVSHPLRVMVLAFLPVASSMYAQRLMSELRRNFSLLTRWLLAATMPLFLVFFLYPETVLTVAFGADYVAAAPALRILAIGFIVNNLLGPNGMTLVAMGDVRFVMGASLATALLNVGVNAALIPPLGIEGAAIASVAAITSVNMICSWRLYSLSHIHPLSRNLVKPVLVSLAIILLLYFTVDSFGTASWWMLACLLVLYYCIYALAIMLTRSVDAEDRVLLLGAQRMVRDGATRARGFMRRRL